jgi:hypothetical protein
MNSPSWLLLLWCGLGGTCGAAVTGAVLGGSNGAGWSLAPRPQATGHGLAWSLLAGLILYPIAYGLAFEALQRADFRLGLALGAAHAAAALLLSRHGMTAAAALRIIAMHLVYGMAIGFLYVTP